MNLIAKRTEKRRVRGGIALETLVDGVAIACLFFGAVVVIGLLLSFSLRGLFAAGSTLVSAGVCWLLLRCLAEHLRLLKKIAGCKFEGSITGPNVETIWSCGNCGQMLHSEHRCDSCHAEIVADDVAATGSRSVG